MKKFSLIVKVMVVSFIVCWPISNAKAAPGDLLFRWGQDYDFKYIYGIVASQNGQIYVVANDHKQTVMVFDRDGNFQFQWGGKGAQDGQFSSPVGIDIDENSGQVYVAESGNHRIQVFDSAGHYLFKWECYNTGDGSSYSPWGIAVDEAAGQVYVAGLSNNQVHAYDLEGNFLFKWGGLGYSGNGSFNHIRGIAVDKDSGRVYVSDSSGCRIQVFDRSGAFLFQWGGRGRGNGQLWYPTGLAVDENMGRVYVTENGFSYSRIQVFDLSGKFLFKLGDSGSQDGQFRNSMHLSVDVFGRVYVSDTGNGRIQVFNPSGEFIEKWKGVGHGDEQVLWPQAIDLDSDDNVYVSSDSSRLLAFDRDGNFLYQLGLSYHQSNLCSNGDGKFCGIRDIFVDDESSRMYVVDGGNNRIQVFDLDGNFLFKWGGQGTADGQFSNPSAVAVDQGGQVYVADQSNRIQVFDLDGNFLFKWGGSGSGAGQFTKPMDITIEEETGYIYVSESFKNCRVQVFDRNGNFLFTWGSFGVGSPGHFYFADGIAADSKGNVYVGEKFSNDIQAFDRNGNYITRFKFHTYGNSMGKIAIDSRNRVFAVDGYYSRVLVYEGVIPPNQAPVADAGPDRTFADNCGKSIKLDGSASFDPDGDQLNYIWSGPFGTVEGLTPTVSLPLGIHTISLTVDDGIETATAEILISVVDNKPPTTSVVISGDYGNNGWHLSPVQVKLMATDSCSGVSSLTYHMNGTAYSIEADSVILDFDEGTNDISYYAKDAVGNVEAPKQLEIKVDLTNPVVAISGVEAGAVYPVCSLPISNYTAKDELSGIDASWDVTTKIYDAAGLVSYSYSVTASDKAGNVATVEVSYEVVENIGGLKALVERYLASGLIAVQMENSLLAQLKDGGKLKQFVNHVNAQSGKKIDATVADVLVNAAACSY
ncbi:MAG: 6-bladed beta-propeller [Desulfurivibrionaceae bacterium]